MRFDWKHWNLGGKIIFIATCIAVISMFMKWVDIGLISQSGFSQEAFLLLAFWIYPVFMLFSNKTIHKIRGLVCSVASTVLTLIYILSKSVELANETINVAGSGAYLFLCASIVLTIGILKYKPATYEQDKTRQNTSVNTDASQQ